MKQTQRRRKLYSNETLLGQGHFVDVSEALDSDLNCRVIVQKLHKGSGPDDRKSFLEEVRTSEQMDHPHIVKVITLDEYYHNPYLVLDGNGNDLFYQRYQAGEILPLETAIRYAQQIADALAYMHRKGIIHRYIRPENLLLSEDGDILLANLGITVRIQHSGSQEVRQPVDVLSYMAPERILGVALPASDQYSLSMLIYAWLTGRAFFHGSADEIIRQHFTASTPFLLEATPHLPPTIRWTLLKGLALNPGERFENMEAFARALSY
jgi:eukaryotic-like serine/threonine-protein kinase